MLEFAAPGQHLALDLLPGTKVEAELVFYPSNYPLRAALRQRLKTRPAPEEMPGYQTTDELLTTYADVLALNPWVEAIPAPLQAVVPVRRNERLMTEWFARDTHGRLLPLRCESITGWKVSALSGGYPITIFGEWNGRSLLPVSAHADGRHVDLI